MEKDTLLSIVVNTLERIESKLDRHISEEAELYTKMGMRVTEVEKDVRWHSRIATAVITVCATLVTWTLYWWKANKS